jgi:hypothetical protein
VDTLTVTGAGACNGSNVTATATAACPGITTPQLSVRVDCPPQPPLQGGLFVYSGSVSNSGNVPLTDVLVTDDKTGAIAQISALAPLESAAFTGSFTPTNCGPDYAIFVTGSARNACTGAAIADQIGAVCPVICLGQSPSQLVILNPQLSGNEFQFSLLTENGVNYTVQFTPLLVPANWQELTNIFGNGDTVTITEPATNSQRYYRILVQ